MSATLDHRANGDRSRRVRARRRSNRLHPGHRRTRGRDRGESLIEIVITIVIISITVGALVTGLGTTAGVSRAHQARTDSDTVMRNVAETLKATSGTCTPGGPFSPTLTVPSGYTVTLTPNSTTCPPVATARRVEIAVVSPDGVREVMTVVVRTS